MNQYGKLKFLDMRGKNGNQLTLLGDKWYDYGKVYQSLIGYDEILLDKNVDMNLKNTLIKHFENYIIDKFQEDTLNKIKYITSSLLFTLIPLHDNSKCQKYYNLSCKIVSLL